MSVILPQTGPTEGRMDARQSRSSAIAESRLPSENDAFARLMTNEQLPLDYHPSVRAESGVEMDPAQAPEVELSRSADAKNGVLGQAERNALELKPASNPVENTDVYQPRGEAAVGDETDRHDQLIVAPETQVHTRIADRDPFLAHPKPADATNSSGEKKADVDMHGTQPKGDHTSTESAQTVNTHTALSTAEMAMRHEAGDLLPVRSGGGLSSDSRADMSAAEVSTQRAQAPNSPVEDAVNQTRVAGQKADVKDRLGRNFPDVIARATPVENQIGHADTVGQMSNAKPKPNVNSEQNSALSAEFPSERAKLIQPESGHKGEHLSNVTQTSPASVGQQALKLLKELPRDSLTAPTDRRERVGRGSGPDTRVDSEKLLAKPTPANVTPHTHGVQISVVSDASNPADSTKLDADRELAPLFASRVEQSNSYGDARSFQAVQTASAAATSPAMWSNTNGTPRAIQDMTVTLTEAPDMLEVSLKPDELGRLSIRLDTNGIGTVVFVMADRAETQDLVRRHIEMLHQQLSDMGFENLSFEFEQGDHNETGRDQPKGTQLSTPAADGIGSAPQVKQVSIATSGLDIRI